MKNLHHIAPILCDGSGLFWRDEILVIEMKMENREWVNKPLNEWKNFSRLISFSIFMLLNRDCTFPLRQFIGSYIIAFSCFLTSLKICQLWAQLMRKNRWNLQNIIPIIRRAAHNTYRKSSFLMNTCCIWLVSSTSKMQKIWGRKRLHQHNQVVMNIPSVMVWCVALKTYSTPLLLREWECYGRELRKDADSPCLSTLQELARELHFPAWRCHSALRKPS